MSEYNFNEQHLEQLICTEGLSFNQASRVVCGGQDQTLRKWLKANRPDLFDRAAENGAKRRFGIIRPKGVKTK